MQYRDVTLKNLGTVNKNRIEIGPLTIWFSYETPVGFSLRTENEYVYMVRQNEWSTTTGKLLNELESDKNKRVDGKTFENKLTEILGRLNIA